MIDQEIELLLTRGREERDLEYKESAPWEDLKFKIAKTVLAMTNIRGGGSIVVGVREDNPGFDRTGIRKEHLSTYVDDHILDFIGEYADPYVNIRIKRTLHESRQYLVIRVSEFQDVPVICRRDGDGTLCQGVIYTRPHSQKPQSCPVRTQTEMREILGMATEKRLRKFLETMQRLGVAQPLSNDDSDRKQFQEELGGL